MNLKNTIKQILEPPRYLYKSKFLNYLNIQKFRCITEKVKHDVKKSRYEDISLSDNYKNQLDDNGYISIPNFFSENEFQSICKAFSNYSNSNKVKYIKNYYNMEWGSGLITINSSHDLDAKIIIDLFNKKKDQLLSLAGYIFKKKIKGNLELSYQDLKLMHNKKDNLDPNRILHADRHYHCAKAYFLIEDNHQYNSPYVYCPNSNKMNRARIELENKISKFRSLNKTPYPISKLDLDNLNTFEKSLILDKNTLVVSDNLGFHKRGMMREGYTRKQIRISFYTFQTNFISKYLRKIVNKYR